MLEKHEGRRTTLPPDLMTDEGEPYIRIPQEEQEFIELDEGLLEPNPIAGNNLSFKNALDLPVAEDAPGDDESDSNEELLTLNVKVDKKKGKGKKPEPKKGKKK